MNAYMYPLNMSICIQNKSPIIYKDAVGGMDPGRHAPSSYYN